MLFVKYAFFSAWLFCEYLVNDRFGEHSKLCTVNKGFMGNALTITWANGVLLPL